MGKIIFKSFVNDVMKDIKKAEKKALRNAAVHVKKKIKQKLKGVAGRSLPGQVPGHISGDLIKGVQFAFKDPNTFRKTTDEVFVGVGPPAYHAHLLEFGTRRRTTKKGANKGQVLPRPFIIPTFQEEAQAVINIISERWPL